MAIQDRMSRMLDEAFGGFDLQRRDPWGEAWQPVVDLVETPSEFVLRVELPGLVRDDVEVEADPRSLVIRGEKRYAREVEQQRYHRMECRYGRFERRFGLPVDVDPDLVEARLQEGVLMVRVPKLQSQAARRIEIQD